MTRGLDFEGKRQALFDLLRHRAVPLNQFDQIYEYLTPLHTLTSLRNDIAHSAWISGQSSNSIQPDWILRPLPSIEPLRNEPGMPKANFIERDYDKVAYTLDDLREIVETLAVNHRSFSNYLHEVGLITQKQMGDQRRQPS